MFDIVAYLNQISNGNTPVYDGPKARSWAGFLGGNNGLGGWTDTPTVGADLPPGQGSSGNPQEALQLALQEAQLQKAQDSMATESVAQLPEELASAYSERADRQSQDQSRQELANLIAKESERVRSAPSGEEAIIEGLQNLGSGAADFLAKDFDQARGQAGEISDNFLKGLEVIKEKGGDLAGEMKSFSKLSKNVDDKVLAGMRAFSDLFSQGEDFTKSLSAPRNLAIENFLRNESPAIQEANQKFGTAGALGAGTKAFGKGVSELFKETGKEVVNPIAKYLAGMGVISGDSVNGLKEGDTQSVVKEVTNAVAEAHNDAVGKAKTLLTSLEPKYAPVLNVADIISQATKSGEVPLFRANADTEVTGNKKGSFSKTKSFDYGGNDNTKAAKALFTSLGFPEEVANKMARAKSSTGSTKMQKVGQTQGKLTYITRNGEPIYTGQKDIIKEVRTPGSDFSLEGLVAKALESKQGQQQKSVKSPEGQAAIALEALKSSVNPKERAKILKALELISGQTEGSLG